MQMVQSLYHAQPRYAYDCGAQTKFGMILYPLREFVSLFVCLLVCSKSYSLGICFAHAPGPRTVVLRLVIKLYLFSLR